MNETYLGDGLYASFDGWQIRLRAPREDGDHIVYLEPGTLGAFERYIADMRRPAPASDADDEHGSPIVDDL
jgi:hypothetical protein